MIDGYREYIYPLERCDNFEEMHRFQEDGREVTVATDTSVRAGATARSMGKGRFPLITDYNLILTNTNRGHCRAFMWSQINNV